MIHKRTNLDIGVGVAWTAGYEAGKEDGIRRGRHLERLGYGEGTTCQVLAELVSDLRWLTLEMAKFEDGAAPEIIAIWCDHIRGSCDEAKLALIGGEV